MNTMLKRMSAALLALMLVISLIPCSADAASYIANWGTRGTLCTALSDNAKAYYTGSNTFDNLSSLTGGNGTSGVTSSALYRALQSFMGSTQKKITSYDDTKPLFKYTDCQNGDTSSISSFYSGTAIGPNWDGGKTWNREHTWPNSKGEGNSENDIMMLRPTSMKENSGRGNTAYGKSSGFYNPNKESNGKYDLRGDVCRIALFVYVRWGGSTNQSKLWGSGGVIESLSVMLEWMEADPVDTWEMGRNDAVQSITGVRNVFVDYPEFAWLLFGKDVPSDISTPSDNTGVSGNPGASTGGNGDSNGGNGGSSDDPVITTGPSWVSAPQAGTSYKLGIVQETNNNIIYFNGKLHSTPYYLGTTQDPAEAVDVTLEAANGGFKLAFLEGGSKKYIKVYQNGDHTNAGIADGSTDTVFTWDAAKKIFVTTVGGEQFYLGTYSYYSSISASPIDKLEGSFTAQMCTFDASSSGGSSGGSNGGTTGGSTGGTSGGSTGGTTGGNNSTGGSNGGGSSSNTPPASQPSGGSNEGPTDSLPDIDEYLRPSTPASKPGPAPMPTSPLNPDDFIKKDEGMSAGVIVAIVLAAVVVLGGGGYAAIYFFVLKPKKSGKSFAQEEAEKEAANPVE